jgi:O-6-methylguanine DNA methyltransferase
MIVFTAAIATPEGVFTARFTEHGLAGLAFPDARARRPADTAGSPLNATQRGWLKTTEQALLAVLAGKKPKRLPPLDLSAGTAFQQAVWSALAAIPRGETRTYSAIARTIGRPTAVRAVGGACGANPIPVLVPCHRVLAAGGRWGGFSGGLDWKRRLLAREGALPVT